MKTTKIIHYVSTGLLTVMMLLSVSMYFLKFEEIAASFTALGYPTYIIQPYGIIKILGLVALWFLRDKFLNEWAYAGFFFAFVLAFFAHLMVGDGEQFGALIALILLVASYITKRNMGNA